MTRRSTAKGRALAEQTREIARELHEARASYWTAILARSRLAGPLTQAIRDSLDQGRKREIGRRLTMVGRRGATAWASRRVGERRAYERAIRPVAEWLADQDRDCAMADTCMDTIGRWARRENRWCEGMRIYRPRWTSGAWQHYWAGMQRGRAERLRHRNRIITLNEGLAITYVGRRAGWMVDEDRGLTRADLQQHARIGLHRAADRYDHRRKEKFSTYAMWWIRHFVDRAHQTTGRAVRVPIAVQALAYKVGRLLDDGAERCPESLAEALQGAARGKITPAKIRQALEHLGCRMISLDEPVGDDEGRRTTFGDLLVDPGALADEAFDRERLAIRLEQALAELPSDLRAVVSQRYGLAGMTRTSQQVARSMKRRPEDVVRMEHRALQALRNQLLGPSMDAA